MGAAVRVKGGGAFPFPSPSFSPVQSPRVGLGIRPGIRRRRLWRLFSHDRVWLRVDGSGLCLVSRRSLFLRMLAMGECAC